MPKINNYVDISTLDKDAKKDYFDRHSPFIHCADNAKKGDKFTVKIKVGDQYPHPDDHDHFIKYVQLWNGETLMGETYFTSGVLGNEPGNVEVDFYIVPQRKLRLTAMSYCTKHGLWQSLTKEIAVE